MPKKVYILGESRGAYRTQNLIKFLLDRQNEYKLYYNSFQIKNRIAKYIHSFLFSPCTILQSNIIYMTTLNVDINIIWELLIGRLFHKKIIVDYYVSVYDTVVLDRQWFKEKSLLAKIAKMIDRFFIKSGSRVIFLNETERKRYCRLVDMPQDSEKYCVVPLCTENMPEINVSFRNELKKELNICWWGSYLPLHGINNILEAASILKRRGIHIKWYFFGNNVSKGKVYRTKAEELKLDNCIFIDNYTFNNGKLTEFLQSNCDLALGNFGDSEKSKNVLINKIIDACAMKVNLLTGYSNAVCEFFDENHDLFMSSNNPKAIADKIEEIINTDSKDLILRTNAMYEIYKNRFSVNAYLKDMQRILEEV